MHMARYWYSQYDHELLLLLIWQRRNNQYFWYFFILIQKTYCGTDTEISILGPSRFLYVIFLEIPLTILKLIPRAWGIRGPLPSNLRKKRNHAISFFSLSYEVCLVWGRSGKTHFPLPVFVWDRKRKIGNPFFLFTPPFTPPFYTTIFSLSECYN